VIAARGRDEHEVMEAHRRASYSRVVYSVAVFDRDAIARAVDLQRRSYKLLRWMTDAIDRGVISYDAAHDFATLPSATFAWVKLHHADLPPDARPALDELRPFCNLFATYLETSFELVARPDDDCFCPACSWLVPIPRLKLKKLSPHDRQRGHDLEVRALKELALQLDRPLSDQAAAELLALREHHEAAGLLAYFHDLARRLAGVSDGRATLVLWRSFAWDEAGAPKPDFELTTEMVLDAEAKLVHALRAQ
jgi:hypothetical protein